MGAAIDRSGTEPPESAGIGFRLAFARLTWDIAVVEFPDDETAIRVIDTLAAAATECPTGETQIPLDGPDGSQMNDEDGEPIFITALDTKTALELDIADQYMAAELATEFVNASGDTSQYRAALRRGPYVVYISGPESETNLRRLVAIADEVLRMAS